MRSLSQRRPSSPPNNYDIKSFLRKRSNEETTRASTSPTNSSNVNPKASLLATIRVSHKKHSFDNDDDNDEDDDLRSLLSGNSIGNNSKHSKVSVGSLGSLLQDVSGGKNRHPYHGQRQQQTMVNDQSYITHLDGMNISNNSINNNLDNSQSSRTSNASNRAASPADTMVRNNTMSGAGGGGGYRKSMMYILGTFILALGLVGPSGLLWDMHGDSENVGSHIQKNGALYNGGVSSSTHGDRHHQLPPHNTFTTNNNYNDNIHPMVRTANKATGSRQHDKFGTKNKRKKRNGKLSDNGDVDSPIHSSIKEAIDNIDKVFLDKAPLTKERRAPPENIDKQQQQQKPHDSASNNNINQQDEDDDFLQDDEPASNPLPFPIIHADDDVLPSNADALDTFTYSLPASDALECRASVIAFVINATDVRDECDGLRKAFDKTCSVNSVAAGGGSGGGGGGAAVGSGGGGTTQRRRRLQEWGQPRFENLRISWLNIDKWQSWLSRWVGRGGDDGFLFVEDEVATQSVWEEAKDIAESGVDLQELAKTMRMRQVPRRKLEGQLDPNVPTGKNMMPVIEERKVEDVEEAPVQSKKEDEQPKISLMIPTADEHIADQMLNDALLLQDSKSEVKSVAQAPTSKDTQQHLQQSPLSETNTTANTGDANPQAAEAARDASESAEAIRTATEAVKNSMTDPKSVEARTCCASILSVFHEHCDPTTTGIEDYSDSRLLVIVFVITVCGMVKSIIRFFNIRWLPEAGGCILVGVMGYIIMQDIPHVQIAFDGDMFLRIMVPPIVFEAAVKINKRSFQRHVIPITIYAIVGTLISTTLTAAILHKGSGMMAGWCTTIPIKESLIFGALISSIDPIAVLSVLNNMGMTDSDTIYVLIFGESLLNDGIAIVLFQTLVHFLDESLVIDAEAVIDAIMHFVVVALGSLTVGIASGACATVYFAVMHGCQTPMVEVIMFFCWAFIPYYICDMVEWSGIVAIVANGFVMDLYVVGQKQVQSNSSVDDEIDFLVNGSSTANINRTRQNRQVCRTFFNYEGHLSALADTHVHFVIEIFATLMETAIFAYLGLFLFSPRYHWNGYLTLISIFATVMGRVIMIPALSHVANILNRMNFSRNRPTCLPRSDMEGVNIDRRMQVVLVFAGLRGAMSYALVEHIPLFDTTTGQGSRLKPELKAMTSASIMFTVFVLGGATSYLMEKIGYTISSKEYDAIEVTPFVRQKSGTPNTATSKQNDLISSGKETSDRVRGSSVRQRGSGSNIAR